MPAPLGDGRRGPAVGFQLRDEPLDGVVDGPLGPLGVQAWSSWTCDGSH